MLRRRLLIAIAPLLLSNCMAFMGPADAVVRVSGELNAAVKGPCTLRMMDALTGKPLHEREVLGSFNVVFSYSGSRKNKPVDFNLSCNAGPWVRVAHEISLPSPWKGNGSVSLGSIP